MDIKNLFNNERAAIEQLDRIQKDHNECNVVKQLDRIQKEHNLNKVYVCREATPHISGASHLYTIVSEETKMPLGTIKFQQGPREDVDSKQGVLDTDLLEIVRDRLKGFQAGAFPSEYTQKALDHVSEALFWLNQRVEDRSKRDVLGKNEK